MHNTVPPFVAEPSLAGTVDERPRPEPSLVRNVGWMLRGNVVYVACQWGMIVVLAKAGTPEMVGKFSLASAIATPVFMLANLQLRAVQATDARREYGFADYLRLRILTDISAVLAIALMAWSHSYAQDTRWVIIAVAVWKGADAISDIVYGLLQSHEWMERIAKSLMIKGALALVIFGVVIYWSHDILWGTLGLITASVVVLASYDVRSAVLILRRPLSVRKISASACRISLFGQPKLMAMRTARLGRFAFPLGLAMILVSLNVNVPRYLIASSLSERELGIFAAMAYVIAGAGTIIEALGQAATPRLAKYYAARDLKSFRRLVLRLVGLGVLIGASGLAVAVLGGGRLLAILYSRDYAARADVFCWVMAVTPVTFAAGFLGSALTAARYFGVQIPLLFATTSVTALMCISFIPRYGLKGAPIALLISALVQCAGMSCILVHACRGYPGLTCSKYS